ncbi:peptide/nickel transport system substrate-binding protein [Lipingzhangella halophila]|uniref:Peptide/nickel transport system substrate-binding protein n=1 Tax=Lipingzhangella halophila TaxID=1783352 RepID=A0A7W7W572_9ACTN|nr:ABC transporter substrate-binding protein [Lipingzhangella halophila]MBB4934962.1 peptide/nickel transport system substrate-binding protein [Lipingzhangella halophila]
MWIWPRQPRPQVRGPLRGTAALALTAALVLTGCAPSAPASTAAGGEHDTEGTVIFYDTSGHATLDPATAANDRNMTNGLMPALYDNLVEFDDDGKPVPGLATDWHYNDDLTEFTLEIREGVRFHDGETLDAEAVAANFERSISLLDQASTTLHGAFDFVTEVEVVDDHTVTMHLDQPNGQIEYWLGKVAGMMISPRAIEESGDGLELDAVGTGPYKLSSFVPNNRARLDRFDDYWDGAEGRPAHLEHHRVSEGQSRLNAVRSGQADLSLIAPRQIPEAENAGLEVLVNEKNSIWTIYLNINRESLSKLKVRRAIMHAIDREGLAEAISYGSGKPATQLVTELSPIYDEELAERYPYDPERARELLAEAGYADGLEISFLLLNTSEYLQLGEALQAMLGEAGIDVQLDVIDLSQNLMFRPPHERGDIMMVRRGAGADALEAYQEVVSSYGTGTQGAPVTPRIDELVEEGRLINADDPDRQELLEDLNEEVVEQAATFPVITRSNVYAYQPGCITGIEPNAGYVTDKLDTVKIAGGCS